MKHKPIKAFAMMAAVIVLGLLLHTQAMAQTENTTTRPQGAVPANQPALMNPSQAEGPKDRTGHQADQPVIVDDQGSVQVTVLDENGKSETKIVSRPAIDANVDLKAGHAAWSHNFYAWMKANPNYESYLSAQEIELVNKNDNLISLYKLKYAVASRNQTRK